MRCRDCRLSALCLPSGGYADLMAMLCAKRVEPYERWQVELDNRLGLVPLHVYAGAELPCEVIRNAKLAMVRARACVSTDPWNARISWMRSPPEVY